MMRRMKQKMTMLRIEGDTEMKNFDEKAMGGEKVKRS